MLAVAPPVITLGAGVADGATLAEATQVAGLLQVQALAGGRVTAQIYGVTAQGAYDPATLVSRQFVGAGSTPVPVTLTAADVTRLGQGLKYASVWVTDAAGGSANVVQTFRIDTVAPDAPVITLGTGVADGATAAEATQPGGIVLVRAETGARVSAQFVGRTATGANDPNRVVIKEFTNIGSAAFPVTLTSDDVVRLGAGPVAASIWVIDPAGNGSNRVQSLSIVSSAPGIATGVLAVAVGTGTVRLSWASPALAGTAAVSDYLIQVSGNNGVTWTTFNDGVSAATTATVSGLAADGTRHLFRVAAVNAAGSGVFSAASNPVTAGPLIAQNDVVSAWPSLPQQYASFDWSERARMFTNFVFDFSNGLKAPDFLPTIAWNQNTDFPATGPYAGKGGVFTLADYYGDQRLGYQNLLINTAAVYSASLVGIDMTRYQVGTQTYNFVDQLSAYFSPQLGRLALEPSAPGYSDWWYEIPANVMYFQLGELYPAEAGLNSRLKDLADAYYKLLVAVGGPTPNFNYLGYDTLTNTPNNPAGFKYTDAGFGMGLIQFFAWQKFGDPKYLTAAKWVMDFYEKSQTNQFFDNMTQYGPYLAARLNADGMGRYTPAKYANWVLAGNAANLGVFGGQVGNVDYFGAAGFKYSYGQKERTYFYETTQYASMLPAVRYDASLATGLAKWMVNASAHARFFYPDQLAADSQSEGSRFIASPARAIPYEAVEIVSKEGKIRFGESDNYRWKTDPSYTFIVNDMGPRATNLSVYSGAWAGLWGGLVKNTNVTGILQLDVNKLDYYSASKAYPTFLYYNPYNDRRVVDISLGQSSDLYDVMTGGYLRDAASGATFRGVSGKASVTMEPQQTMMVVVLPRNAQITYAGDRTLANNVVIAYQRPTATTVRSATRSLAPVTAATAAAEANATPVVSAPPQSGATTTGLSLTSRPATPPVVPATVGAGWQDPRTSVGRDQVIAASTFASLATTTASVSAKRPTAGVLPAVSVGSLPRG